MPDYTHDIDQAVSAGTMLYRALARAANGQAHPLEIIGYPPLNQPSLRDLGDRANEAGTVAVTHYMSGDAEVQEFVRLAMARHRARNQAFPSDLPAAMQAAKAAADAFWPDYDAAIASMTVSASAGADHHPVVAFTAGGDIKAALDANGNLTAFVAAMKPIAGEA